MLFARTLSFREYEELRSALADKDLAADLRTRLLIVMLSAQGKSVPEITQELGLHPTTVWRWINTFNREGLSRLLSRKPRSGRKPKFTRAEREQIVNIARTNPADLGLPFSAWSSRKLAAYLKACEISVGRETLRRILKAAGISPSSGGG